VGMTYKYYSITGEGVTKFGNFVVNSAVNCKNSISLVNYGCLPQRSICQNVPESVLPSTAVKTALLLSHRVFKNDWQT